MNNDTDNNSRADTNLSSHALCLLLLPLLIAHSSTVITIIVIVDPRPVTAHGSLLTGLLVLLLVLLIIASSGSLCFAFICPHFSPHIIHITWIWIFEISRSDEMRLIASDLCSEDDAEKKGTTTQKPEFRLGSGWAATPHLP